MPYFDRHGFESYELDCGFCGASLAGIVDPLDGAPLQSVVAQDSKSDCSQNDPRPVQHTPGSVAAACTADYACTIFPTKTLFDPGACGVTNRRGIKLCHQILTSN